MALIGNFFFQGMVGQIWGQLPVTLLLGIILSIFFREISRKKLSTHD
jgi:ABC-type enterochelin transport system permease subunit